MFKQLSRRDRLAAPYYEALAEIRSAGRTVHKRLATKLEQLRGHRPAAAHRIELVCPDPAKPRHGLARVKV